MLIFDLGVIGNKLYEIRKKKGMTQSEVAEAAEISDRTYADIERGTANMRIGTLLQVCKVLDITPDDVLTENDANLICDKESIIEQISELTPKDKNTVLELLEVFIRSTK